MQTPSGPTWGVRFAITSGPADIGARVVVRHRLPDGRLTDVLGVLEVWSAAVVRVRTRTGDAVELAEDDVVAAKRIPPPPARR